MATIASASLTIAAGPGPDSVVVRVHGVLDLPAATSLQRLLDAILQDRDIHTIRVDLHDVRGVDVGGISGLGSAAARADQRGAELTLSDPPELLLEAIEMEGLTGLVHGGRDCHQRSGTPAEIDLRHGREDHPSGRPHLSPRTGRTDDG